ncbi:exoprotein [Qipengyuania marisflavi]|uniref:Exoprotein n=2 Tax=Qipengyuania marisflavi TaxID=2486356 RepID=A0A5S3PFX5_9SPHN|nr:exoprotein [Qipengyuania marisflavi]
MDGVTNEPDGVDEGEYRSARSRWRRKRWLVPGVLALVLAGLLAFAWFTRESIADDFVADQLEAYDLPATYQIQRIGPRTQILSDVQIGSADAPDFTAKRVIVRLRHRFGVPSIDKVTLVEPRLYGRYRNGQLSFGSLDKVIFADSGGPPGLPAINLAIRDGRGLIDTDFGPVGLKLAGAGLLRDGFAGIIAANAPALAFADCAAERVTAYGKVSTSDGKPKFTGPLRLGALTCKEQGIQLADFDMEMEASANAELANPALVARIDGGAMRYGDNKAGALRGTVRAQMRDALVTARYTLAARSVETPQALAAVMTAEGVLRGRDGFERIEVESAIEGNGLRLGPQLVASINSLSRSGQGTLVAPIVSQIAAALQQETRGSALEADVRLRKTGDALSLLAPRAELRGGSGARILTLSRVELTSEGNAPARIAGNIATGGPGIPKINGRMERSASGDSAFRLAMAPYTAGGSSLAIPQMTVAQGAGGALGFSGRVESSGPLPGGAARGLRVPVSGRWTPGGELALWTKCTAIAFDRLELANLRFEKRGLTLCPASGRPILQYGSGGLKIAAGAPSLDLAGYLGETPITLSSGPVGFAYPGVMKARAVDIALGPKATASRFRISDLTARLGDNIAGSFDDAEVTLAAIPLDIRNASGNWDYTRGKVALTDGAFRLLDREEPDRFEPLEARDGTLTLIDNIVTAHADLRHPGTDRIVTIADIRHSLETGSGYADLDVPGLQFDSQLQPDQLTTRALGVIANARGTVTGTGRIDWASNGTITSTGEFTSDEFDFAAAFGPVQGASGTIVFSDLLGMTTAPGQKIRIASVNPGVEVLGGEIEFELRGGQLLAVSGGSWPFMGGRLILRNVDLNFGVSEQRSYIFEIVGLQADEFLAQMDLKNISADGTFDGTIPIIFDTSGNGRIDRGVLISRPPGGNISYVGALTYEDMSPMVNFAFDALKSMDYTQMSLAMDGPLTGEIVTKVRFDGVKQGEGTKQNFITKRLAALPIQFRINIKAQFYQLITSVKAMYDPASVRDPRDLGLLSDDGKRLLRRSITGEEAEPDIDPEDLIPDEPPIQE